MTEITPSNQTIKRRTAAMIRDGGKLRSICLQLHPGFIEIWCERSKKSYSLTYSLIYQIAADKEAQRLRAERKEKIKAKREGRA